MSDLNATLDHIGNVPVHLALKGVAPSCLAAMELVQQSGGRLVHLTLSSRGLRCCVLICGQQVVHAEACSAEVRITADRVGRVRWVGEAALKAMAILANRPAEVEIIATTEPVAGHDANMEWPLATALMEMALTIDHGLAISALPCTLET